MTSLGADEQIQQLNMFTITHCLSFGFLVYMISPIHSNFTLLLTGPTAQMTGWDPFVKIVVSYLKCDID